MAEFFHMGGYGGYVGAAFGFATLALLGLFLQSWWMMRKRETALNTMRNSPEAGRRAIRPKVVKPAVQPANRPKSSGTE